MQLERGAKPRIWPTLRRWLGAWRTPAELARLAKLTPQQVSRALRREAARGHLRRRERHTGRPGRPEFAYRLE